MASPCVVFGASKYEGESLKGMSGVLVNVSVSDTTLQTHGITEATLKTEVEVKLRVARIKPAAIYIPGKHRTGCQSQQREKTGQGYHLVSDGRVPWWRRQCSRRNQENNR